MPGILDDGGRDAAFMVRDLGELVSRGGDSFYALIDNSDRFNDDGDVIGQELRMTWAVGDAAIAELDEIVRGSGTFQAREVMFDDAGLGHCRLSDEINR